MRMLRFRLGRWFLHIGLRVLPPGRVQSELYALVDQWATKVHAIVDAPPSQRSIR